MSYLLCLSPRFDFLVNATQTNFCDPDHKCFCLVEQLVRVFPWLGPKFTLEIHKQCSEDPPMMLKNCITCSIDVRVVKIPHNGPRALIKGFLVIVCRLLRRSHLSQASCYSSPLHHPCCILLDLDLEGVHRHLLGFTQDLSSVRNFLHITHISASSVPPSFHQQTCVAVLWWQSVQSAGSSGAVELKTTRSECQMSYSLHL